MSKISKKTEYITVKNEAETVLVEKKSKFIASVSPAGSEEEALDFLKRIRSVYPDASHHVYAYIIDENNIFRYSDDGEPGGTAGMPVLDVMRKENIVDAAVVVTRYFGGTLLGTGGLVHAYSAAAKEAICAGGIVKRSLCDTLSVRTDYTLAGKVQYKISSEGLILDDTIYGNDVCFYIQSPVDATKEIVKSITDMTNARAVITVIGQKYVDLPNG